MEKLDKTVRREVPPVKLYASDLRSVDDFLRQNGELPLEIHAGGYRLESLNELSAFKKWKNLKTFHIRSSHITLDLGEKGGTIVGLEDTVQIRGIISQVETILLRNRQARFPRFFTGFLFFLTFCLVIATVALLNSNLSWAAGATAIGTVLVFLIAMLISKPHSILVPVDREDRPSFLQRNRDQILLALISAIIGSVLTLITTTIVLIARR